MTMNQTTIEMQECIDNCQTCHATCLNMAANFCLEKGGAHVAPDHFRLMLDCARICATSVDFMLQGSKHFPHICRECAEICDGCAASCEALDGMEDCVAACRASAQTCRIMAQMA